MRTTNAPAAARNIIAIVNAPLPLNLEFAVGVVGAFVCVFAIFSGAIFVRAAFVGFNNFTGGGGFDSVVGDGWFGDGFVGTSFDWVGGSKWVPTFVPTITSGGVSTTGDGGGGDGLFLTVVGGAGG